MLERQCLWCLVFLLKKRKKIKPNNKAFIPEVQKTNPAFVMVNNNKAEALTKVFSRVIILTDLEYLNK